MEKGKWRVKVVMDISYCQEIDVQFGGGTRVARKQKERDSETQKWKL